MPISEEIKKLLTEKNYLDKILQDGHEGGGGGGGGGRKKREREKANKIASEKVKKIHEIVGF